MVMYSMVIWYIGGSIVVGVPPQLDGFLKGKFPSKMRMMVWGSPKIPGNPQLFHFESFVISGDFWRFGFGMAWKMLFLCSFEDV